MSNVSPAGNRYANAIALRNAALILLAKSGKLYEKRKETIWFERHTPENPEPRLSACLSRHAHDGHLSLDVWGTLKGKHVKVLNMAWIGAVVDVITFRRGEWEYELLAMGRAMAIH